jgi:hypothetical protein
MGLCRRAPCTTKEDSLKRIAYQAVRLRPLSFEAIMPRGTDRPWDRDDDDDRPRSRRRGDEDDDDDRPRRRRREDDDDYDDRPRREGRRQQAPTNGTATAALILGVLSFFTLCLTGIPAIICGLIALGKPVGRGMAVAGICLGTLGTIGGGIAGYFGYMAAESARARVKDTNNLKQIGVAMHNQHSAMNRISAPYATDNFGKQNKDLSWRVGILPYIEQDNLYKQYRLDEAWDSPANRKLSDTAIATYTTPLDEVRASTKTPYRVFVSPARQFDGGARAMFTDDGQPVSITSITDGTSNTIMVAHAFEQVPWAEPRELKYDSKGPLPKLGHPNAPGGFTVLMADGSVRFIRNDVSERTLRAAITKDGGEVLGGDW